MGRRAGPPELPCALGIVSEGPLPARGTVKGRWGVESELPRPLAPCSACRQVGPLPSPRLFRRARVCVAFAVVLVQPCGTSGQQYWPRDSCNGTTEWRKHQIILEPYFSWGVFLLIFRTVQNFVRPEVILLSKVSLFFVCILDNRTYHFQAEDEQDYVA